MRFSKPVVACGVLLAVLAIASGYLLVGILKVDPRKHTYDVTIALPQSAGLQETSTVSLYGIPIGTVRTIQAMRDEIRVSIAIDSTYRVPATSPVVVQNLSAAGEQYLDFRPSTSAGPYLVDGAAIQTDQVQNTATVGSLLAKFDKLGQLIDPAIITRLGQVIVDVASDQSALAGVGSGVNYLGSTLKDKEPAIRRMFRAVQVLDTRFMAMNGPAALAPAAGTLSTLAPAMGRVLTAFNSFAVMSADSDAWNGKVGPFMDKLLTQLSILIPAFGSVAAVLTPVTGQFRGIRVNAAAFTDLWGQTFPAGGPMRVQIPAN